MMNELMCEPRNKHRSSHIALYWPLLVLIGVSILAATALARGVGQGIILGLHYYMGFALCAFAMLKLFNPAGFKEGFSQHDLLAQIVPFYAYLYPYVELLLGLAYFSFFSPEWLYGATILVFAFGTYGIFQTRHNSQNVYRPWEGALPRMSLCGMSLIENISMMVIAMIMLFA